MKIGKPRDATTRSGNKLIPEGDGLPLSREAGRLPDWLEGGLALLDAEHRILDLNRALTLWLGTDRAQQVGANFDKCLAARCPEIEPVLARAWAEAAPLAQYPFAMTSGPEQQWLCLEVARNSAGWFLRLSSILPPLRELLEEGGAKEADFEKQQLRVRVLRAESHLDQLIQRWPGVLFSQRADFSFQHANGKIEELTGLSPEAWRSQPLKFWEVVHEADVEELKRQCHQAVIQPAGVTTTYRIRHAVSGKVSYILEYRQASVSKSGMVLGYEGVWLDITRQTIAEKRLSIAAWKETLALLTMGLAHDFNNLMSGIVSLSELMIAQIGPEAPQTPTLNMIKQSSLQASQLIQRIVSLHRSKTGLRQYLDLNQVVPELVELVCKVLPRRIRVETKLAEGQLPVYMDGIEFRQVVLNLALNAADAMPDRGVLMFRVTAHAEAQELKHAQGKFPRVPCVCLSVQDNGTGISERHLAHIFDPFFTTKPLTKGSGLGLHNARVFVEEHGGAISVDSVEGAGATFQLWLPQADFTEAERLAAQNAGHRRSLLLVGQPGLATDTVTEFLRTHNFYAVVTHSPARAAELLVTDENSLNGVMVLADPHDDIMLNFVKELHDRNLASRVVLQIIGGNSDRIDSRIFEKASLVLASTDEESVILKKLESLFPAKAAT
jgi:two-component system cell cycle sensor histidine kinase/response regulator CckA